MGDKWSEWVRIGEYGSEWVNWIELGKHLLHFIYVGQHGSDRKSLSIKVTRAHIVPNCSIWLI